MCESLHVVPTKSFLISATIPSKVSTSGKRIFSGVTDKSICFWDLNGSELECWKGQRMIKTSDLAITSDGKQIIGLCKESAILLLNRELKIEKVIEENHTITSFSLSRDDEFLAVNLINEEIHLWKITGDPKFVASYKGHKRSRFVVRSCFGGFQESYIASGSEDSQVYIWHRGTGNLIAALTGHAGAVNCVSWNPKDPQKLASASELIIKSNRMHTAMEFTVAVEAVNDSENISLMQEGNEIIFKSVTNAKRTSSTSTMNSAT